MNAINPPAIGPNNAAKNAPMPYAVWISVSGIPVGIFTYMKSNVNNAAPKPVATIVFVLNSKSFFSIFSSSFDNCRCMKYYLTYSTLSSTIL